jgi:hypothetical protein
MRWRRDYNLQANGRAGSANPHPIGMTMRESVPHFRSTLLLAAAVMISGWMAAADAEAQSAASPEPARKNATELAVFSGGAVDLPGGARGGEFWTMQLRWGQILTAPHGPGALRGTLEFVLEAVPAMLLSQDGTIYGAGINPFFWQYNFTLHPHLVPYIQVGGGMLLTTSEFPADTSSFNFTPQAGFGVYWFTQPDRALSFGVRYHHTSNAGIRKPNPGHNALYFYGGLSWWR